MSDYTPVNDFSAKDSLTTGDPEKIILGSDVDNETAAIQTAVATKFDVTNWATLGATLGNGSIADIAAFTDQNADVIYGWDDSASAAIQFTLGGALNTSGTVLQVTAANILTQLLTVDGSGSGLDADLLDGESSAAFHAAANITGSHTLPDGVLSTNVPLLNASNTFTGATQTIDANAALIHVKSANTSGGYVQFSLSGATKGYVGAGLNGGGVGDMGVRAESGGFTFSGNAGSTQHFALSSAGVLTTPNASAAEVGYKGALPQVKTLDYTLVLADAGKWIQQTGTSKTVTIPANASVAFPDGTIIVLYYSAAGSLAITSDTLIWAGPGSSGTRTIAASSMLSIYKYSSTVWIVTGVGIS